MEKKSERDKPVKRSSKAAFGIVPAAILCAALARCGAGPLGLGGGAGAPGTPGAGITSDAPGTKTESLQSSETEAPAETEEAAKTKETAETSETAETETGGSIAGSDQNTKMLPGAAEGGEAEDPVPVKEYIIEIKKDQYYIDGMEVNKARIEELLQEENTAIRIDNNYGSQKAVSELKELFKKHDTPFIE